MAKRKRPDHRARQRAKKRKLKAANAIITSDVAANATTLTPVLSRADRLKAAKHARQATQQRLDAVENDIRTGTVVASHQIKQLNDDNRDWRMRLEAVNASFRQTQQAIMQNFTNSHNELRNRVARDIERGISICETLKTVGDTMEGIEDKVEGMGDTMEGVGDKVNGMRDKVGVMEDEIEKLRAENEMMKSRMAEMEKMLRDQTKV